jgi:hypothetical protein
MNGRPVFYWTPDEAPGEFPVERIQRNDERMSLPWPGRFDALSVVPLIGPVACDGSIPAAGRAPSSAGACVGTATRATESDAPVLVVRDERLMT